MRIRESAENYLETILLLSRDGQVRSVDIASRLGYSKPSVSVAMKKLRLNGYIKIDRYGHIALTGAGLSIAKSMHERHALISGWLISLGVDPETAENDACEIEHVISERTFLAIKKHIEGP